jgi:ATP-dependent HslUV protease ATP-binding subunit HslU
MERLLDEVSFHAPEMGTGAIHIDGSYVDRMLADIVKSDDLSRYIL